MSLSGSSTLSASTIFKLLGAETGIGSVFFILDDDATLLLVFALLELLVLLPSMIDSSLELSFKLSLTLFSSVYFALSSVILLL